MPQDNVTTLSYLELLQQQLQLMLKHQHENMHLKQQLEQQAERKISQSSSLVQPSVSPSQLSKNTDHVKQTINSVGAYTGKTRLNCFQI